MATREKWAKQQRRSICNGIKINADWNAKLWSTWKNYDGETIYGQFKEEANLDEKGKKKQADDIVKMCKEIQGAVRELETYLQ